jgi:DNA-binding CsgD family transcriptional regulator
MNLTMDRWGDSGEQDERQLEPSGTISELPLRSERLLSEQRDALAIVVGHLPFGVVVLDARAGVIFVNRSAHETLAEQDGLSLVEGRLSAERPCEADALARALKIASDSLMDGDLSVCPAMPISRRSHPTPLSLVVTPAGPYGKINERSRATTGRPAAVVYISDPERSNDTPTQWLSQLYGLTRTEAALVLMLVQGDCLDKVADELSISIHTARSHLKQIFRKTGVKRQSELLRLMLTGPAALRFD